MKKNLFATPTNIDVYVEQQKHHNVNRSSHTNTHTHTETQTHANKAESFVIFVSLFTFSHFFIFCCSSFWVRQVENIFN